MPDFFKNEGSFYTQNTHTHAIGKTDEHAIYFYFCPLDESKSALSFQIFLKELKESFYLLSLTTLLKLTHQ